MNTEFLHFLHLNPERVARDLDFSAGLAKSYQQHSEESARDNHIAYAISATYFRRAASNALLLGSFSHAKDLFLEASQMYQKLGLPYSVVLAALSPDSRDYTNQMAYGWLFTYSEHEIAEKAIPQLGYVILAQTAFADPNQIQVESFASARSNLDPYRLHPLGALGISVGTLLDLSDALYPEIGQRKVDLVEGVMPFLSAYHAAIRHASYNRYHWERLALPFHPTDSDIFGVLAMANIALRMRHNTSIQVMLKEAAIGRESKELIFTILNGLSDQDSKYQ